MHWTGHEWEVISMAGGTEPRLTPNDQFEAQDPRGAIEHVIRATGWLDSET
ncbi:hypothetical protein N0A02_06695 [Paraburkholderia acidicola]|uniref:Immunity protein 27 of polymorphic toxin system n=1 Tax=Paraburkholderia acidicola TaxID=1912599 RepID=A0ABV1LK73_9BURK